jgi:hypothetical protein
MAAETFKVKGTDLTFKFGSPEAAEHFKSWLCGSGEQHYWGWMEYREDEEDGPITGLRFNYHENDIIKVECGRLDDE